jgi:hypothetical protein
MCESGAYIQLYLWVGGCGMGSTTRELVARGLVVLHKGGGMHPHWGVLSACSALTALSFRWALVELLVLVLLRRISSRVSAVHLLLLRGLLVLCCASGGVLLDSAGRSLGHPR